MKFSTYMIQRIKWRMMEIDRACAKKALKGDGIQMSLDAIKEDDNSDAWHPSYTEDKETLSMLDSLSDREGLQCFGPVYSQLAQGRYPVSRLSLFQ
jgi:hypothetical protein